jgi:hypothetical protein
MVLDHISRRSIAGPHTPDPRESLVGVYANQNRVCWSSAQSDRALSQQLLIIGKNVERGNQELAFGTLGESGGTANDQRLDIRNSQAISLSLAVCLMQIIVYPS